MAQPQLLQIKLSRFDAQPWGFRLQGGVDFAQPLLVQKVNAGSLSEQAGLQPGDAVIKINDVDVFNCRHKDAQDIVVRSGNNFVITVQRGGSTWRPHVQPTGNLPQPNSPYLQTVTKTSLAHHQPDSQHIGCGYNNAARPFANGGGDGGVKSIVNKQYNTPVGIYSDESIAETLSAQAEVLAGGVLGVNFKKNEKEYQPDRSEVLKFLREEETGQSTPEPHSAANFYWTQSHAIGGNERRTPQQIRREQEHEHEHQPEHQQHQDDERIGMSLQANTLAPSATHRPSMPVPKDATMKKEDEREAEEEHDPRVIVLPICPALQGPEYRAEMEAAAAAALATDGGNRRLLSATGHPACQMCGVGIVGVFVRIKDKNLHQECFKCATCGTSLKNQGYYNFNNKLYCEIHAKLAAQQNPPAGTEGYVPVPIKPNTKLSANTISSALNVHGYGGNGYANGSSTPTPTPAPLDELPLPPPPSPTQLLQFEGENVISANAFANANVQAQAQAHCAISAPIQDKLLHQHQHQQQHTRTHSSLSSMSSGSNTSSSGVGGCGAASGNSGSMEAMEHFGSPLHSRQMSGSSASLDNYSAPMSPPPPPPPPMPTPQQQQQQQHPQQQQKNAQNENDMNTQNKSHNAYNQLLKEYSNKLQQSQNSNTTLKNNTNSNNNNHNQNRNNTAKPFVVGGGNMRQHSTQPHIAALSATLANQLKFNSNQAVAAPSSSSSTTAAAEAAAVSALATATAIDTIDTSVIGNMADNAADVQSIYSQNSTTVPAQQGGGSSDQPFEYVTLHGNVIRSVQPSGKGANPPIYKVNQGYARPYGQAAPKSPVSYPPQQQQQSPRPGGNNPYATLPRTNVGQQGRNVQKFSSYNSKQQQQQHHHQYQQQQHHHQQQQQKQQYRNSYPSASTNKYATLPNYNTQSINNYNSYIDTNNNYNNSSNNYSQFNREEDAEAGALQPQYEEECYEDDTEVALAARRQSHTRSTFAWPPPRDDSHDAPTAAPLYIPPPETQHMVVSRPVEQVPPLPPGSATARLDPQPQQPPQPQPQLQIQSQPAVSEVPVGGAPQWQSYSAPQLCRPLAPAVTEQESSSESYTSTSTTTTTTSEEYQRMYAAQMQAYQMQQAYEQQTGSEFDYQLDQDYPSGRRSAQECVGSLAVPLSTYQLVDMVREVTPSPVPTPAPNQTRHVAFVEEPEIKELPPKQSIELETIPETVAEWHATSEQWADEESANEDRLVIDQRREILESERMFQATPEIKIEIAPVRQIPPSKIPNPMPKEWINPMIRVLTTAPETPFHLVECPFPKPCDGNFEEEAAAAAEAAAAKMAAQQTQPPQPIAEPKPAVELPRESPPRGTRLTQAMITAPEFEMRFVPPASEGIPLPEETEPYMPPPIDMKPYMRDDYRPKSPFLSALTTAPEKPFEGHFERDVPIHLIDLPTPKEHLKMSDALCTASDRCYTPLNPENATQRADEREQEQKKKKQEFQVLDHEEELGITPLRQLPDSVTFCTTEQRRNSQRKSSAFAAMQAFQPSREPLPSASSTGTPRPSITSTAPPINPKLNAKPTTDNEPDATTLLTESIGQLSMGEKTNEFMQEAGKIISNMLEARLANGHPAAAATPLSHASSAVSLHSNSSSNLSKSPMIVRKRLDLDDFKNIDPTQPAALQSVVALQGSQKAQPQVQVVRVEQTLPVELPAHHPMSKILDICDNANGKAIDKAEHEPVAFRNHLRRTGEGSGATRSTHAADRRSYIDPKPTIPPASVETAGTTTTTGGASTANSAPNFSVSVKALGPHSETNATMSEENERAVSQLLKDGKRPICCQCNKEINSGPFITALGRIWCPDHFICVNANCRRPLQDIGFVEEKGDLYCEYCFEKYLAPSCSKCGGKIKGDCLNAIGKHFHPECFTCGQCGRVFGNRPFFLEDGKAYCEADWNELFTTKCFACGFPVEAGDRWVEALNHNYHSQCFNCTYCKQNLEGQSFYNKGGRPFCKNHAR